MRGGLSRGLAQQFDLHRRADRIMDFISSLEVARRVGRVAVGYFPPTQAYAVTMIVSFGCRSGAERFQGSSAHRPFLRPSAKAKSVTTSTAVIQWIVIVTES